MAEIKKTTSKDHLVVKIALPKEIFGIENVNTQAMFDTVLKERNSRRQGTHQVKSRADVSGTGKKPWKQKGTGKARAGSLRAPHFVGGGRAFGPQNERNYNIKVNKKVVKLALNSALTLKAQENKIVVIKEFELKQPKTKEVVFIINELKLKEAKKILFVSSNEILWKSASNIPNVSVLKASSLSVEATMWADVIIFTEQEINAFLSSRKVK